MTFTNGGSGALPALHKTSQQSLAGILSLMLIKNLAPESWENLRMWHPRLFPPESYSRSTTVFETASLPSDHASIEMRPLGGASQHRKTAEAEAPCRDMGGGI